MMYVYELLDPDTGELVHKGTARELAAKGVVDRPETVATLWRDYQRRKPRAGGTRRWEMRREKMEVRREPRAKKEQQPKPGTRRPKAGKVLLRTLEDPDALQLDVRRLEYYNAAARQRGVRQLSYGQWAEKGKPEVPTW